MVVVAIVAIAITPMLDTLTLLIIAIAIRGFGQGLNLPLMMSIASRAVGIELQGRVAALRISFNRFGGALVPIGMGALAEVIGLEYAFYVVGAGGVVLVCLLAIWVATTPGFDRGR
jgi:MFS family permease